jgi:lipoyl-dependent peroxiredoxin
MAIRESSAIWEGSSREGKGSMRLASGMFEGPFTWASRFREEPGTNPEELIAAAHAGCYSIALASALTKAGHVPARIDTTCKIHMDDSPTITESELSTVARVTGIDEASFLEIADEAKRTCPVSRALASIKITLTAKLAS